MHKRAGELLYAGINVPLALVHGPGAVLPALFAKEAGLSLVIIGSIMVALRILDVVIDPLIGYWSDRTSSRFGRRKPWIAVGSVVVCIGALLAFNPSANTGYWYFGFSIFLLVFGWSLVETPYAAWLNELTGDYHGRSRMATQRVVAGYAGNAMFLALPLSGLFATTAMTPQVTAAGAWLVIGLFAVLLPPALLMLRDAGANSIEQQSRLRDVLRSVRGNPAFWRYAAVQGFSGLSSGIVSGLFFIWLDSYLQLGSKYSHVMLPVMLCGLIGAIFWLRATMSIDKHRVVSACVMVTAATNLAMLFISPGDWALTALIVSFAVSSFAGAGSSAAQTSLLADTVDYGTLKTGMDHAGNYFAAATFINKIAMSVGTGLGLVISGLFGYTVSGPNDRMAMNGFFMAIVFIPCALNLLAAWIAWGFPIDRQRQREIRAELDARAAAGHAKPQRPPVTDGAVRAV